MKTIFKFAIRNTAKLAGYTYGYSSIHAIKMSKLGVSEAKAESKSKKES